MRKLEFMLQGRLLAVVLAVVFLFSLPAFAKGANPLIVFDDYPPYHYWKNGTPAGLDIALLSEASVRMGIKFRYERRTWQRSLQEVEYGDVTGLCAGMRTAKRERFAIYPSEYLSLETNWVISLSESGVKVNNLDDLRGLQVGVVTGYAYGPGFDGLVGLQKIYSKSDALLLKKLLSGRLDVIVGNDMVMKYLAGEAGQFDKLNFQLKLNSEPLYLILSRKQAISSEIAATFSRVLREMQEDGTYGRIRSRY